jgi:hypothetical protein
MNIALHAINGLLVTWIAESGRWSESRPCFSGGL